MSIKKTICVLSVDMGTSNSCYSITRHTKSSVEWVTTNMLPVTVTNMGLSIQNDTEKFKTIFTNILDKYKPDIVSPELFMQRSFRSNLASPISYMIGIMACLCSDRNIDFKPIMPSLWKRRAEKELIKLEDLYDRTYPIAQRLPDHPVDSLLIGIYHNEKCFKCLTVKKAYSIVDQIKGSTSIQKYLKKEHEKKKQDAKNKRALKQKKSKVKTQATKGRSTPVR